MLLFSILLKSGILVEIMIVNCDLKVMYHYPHRHSLTPPVLIYVRFLYPSRFNFFGVAYGPCLDANTSMYIHRIQNLCLGFMFDTRRRKRISHNLVLIQSLNMSDGQYLKLCTIYH